MHNEVEMIMNRWLSFTQKPTDIVACGSLRFSEIDSSQVIIEIAYAFDDETTVFSTSIARNEFSSLVMELLHVGKAHYVREKTEGFLELTWRLCTSGFDFALRARGQSGLSGRMQLAMPYYMHVELPGLASLINVSLRPCVAGEQANITKEAL